MDIWNHQLIGELSNNKKTNHVLLPSQKLYHNWMNSSSELMSYRNCCPIYIKIRQQEQKCSFLTHFLLPPLSPVSITCRHVPPPSLQHTLLCVKMRQGYFTHPVFAVRTSFGRAKSSNNFLICRKIFWMNVWNDFCSNNVVRSIGVVFVDKNLFFKERSSRLHNSNQIS